MRTGFGRIGVAAAFATMVWGASGARAQHVVTEAESGKLTLEALTAVPAPPRPVYRAYYRPAFSERTLRARAREAHYVAATWHARLRHRRTR